MNQSPEEQINFVILYQYFTMSELTDSSHLHPGRRIVAPPGGGNAA